MEKNLLNDVVEPAHKRSIRDIPIPNSRRPFVDKPIVDTENHPHAIDLKKMKIKSDEEPISEDYYSQHNYSDSTAVGSNSHTSTPEYAQTNTRKKSSGRRFIFPSIVVAIILVVFFIMNFLHSAEVTIYPKNASAAINNEIQIVNFEDKKIDSDLTFRTLEFPGQASEVVVANGEEYVSEKASGTITIYNSYTNKPQGLIKNTRFEAPNGKIYRIQETITVPGYKTVSGEIVPGQLDVTVYADEAGTGYENGMVNFTIPGFKGQPQFDSFYGKSKTAIAGGFVGVRKIISEEQLKSVNNSITEKLKENLRQSLKDQLPSSLVTLDSENESFNISEIKREESGSDNISLKISGTLSVKVIDKNKLSEKFAETVIGGNYVIGSPILVTNLDEIVLKLTENNTVLATGNAKFVWQLDPEELKQKIVGKNKSEVITTLADFPGIDRIEIDVAPFWKSSFPDNTDRITIEQVLPN